MSFKIAFIGAGSITFTRNLVKDILSVPEFSGVELCFMDINGQNLDMVTKIVQRDIDANGLGIRVKPTLDRKEALRGARYIFNVARIGCLEGFSTDVEIPLKYGVDQCVGDTLCAGGIMYGQRGIALHAGLLQGHPRGRRAWRAVPQLRQSQGHESPGRRIKYGGVRCVGLCHGVQGGHWQIAQALGAGAEGRGHHLRGHQPPDLVHPGQADKARLCRANGSSRASSSTRNIPQHGEGAHRHAAALRLLLHRVQRPPVRIRAVVPQAAGGNPQVDQT